MSEIEICLKLNTFSTISTNEDDSIERRDSNELICKQVDDSTQLVVEELKFNQMQTVNTNPISETKELLSLNKFDSKKSLKLRLYQSLQGGDQESEILSPFELKQCWPILRDQFLLFSSNVLSSKILISYIGTVSDSEQVSTELLHLTSVHMRNMLLSPSGIDVLQCQASCLNSMFSYKKLYTLASHLFKHIFDVYDINPNLDLYPLQSTVFKGKFLEYVYTLEGWNSHQSLDDFDLFSPLLAHIRDLFGCRVVSCNPVHASRMANLLVNSLEVQKNYKTIIKSLFDKMVVLLQRPGFLPVQQSMFTKLCSNDLKFLTKQFQKNAKKLLKSQYGLEFWQQAIQHLPAQHLAQLVRDLSKYPPDIQVKHDLFQTLLKSHAGIQVLATVYQSCKNPVQVRRLKSKFDNLMPILKDLQPESDRSHFILIIEFQDSVI